MFVLDESFFSELEQSKEYKSSEIENKEVLDKILFSEDVDSISFEDFNVFFQNIENYAEVVYLNNDYLGKLLGKTEEIVGVHRKRRVL